MPVYLIETKEIYQYAVLYMVEADTQEKAEAAVRQGKVDSYGKAVLKGRFLGITDTQEIVPEEHELKDIQKVTG